MRLALWALLLTGCGARALMPIGGDSFSFFPPPAGTPPPITCGGERDARWACATQRIDERLGGRDVNGALVLTIGDDAPRFYVHAAGPDAITPDTRFFVASVSKMFLAAAAVSLSLEGRLDLDAPLSRILPELDDAEIGHATISQLLSHTAGLPVGEGCAAEEDLDDRVRSVGPQRLLSTPGAVWNYSNVGYAFVAAAIERVTGERFEDVVHARVLVPAGLPDATYDSRRRHVAGGTPPRRRSVARCVPPVGSP